MYVIVTDPAVIAVTNPLLASTVAKALDDDHDPPASPFELNCNVDPSHTLLPPEIAPAFKSDVMVATTAVLDAVVQLPEVAST